MRKFTMLCSVLTAVLISGTMAAPVLAASAPGDDVSRYSYNTGRQSYEARMAEEHAWYDNADASAADGYSFSTGSQAALSRSKAFEGMPAEENAEKEEVEAWFKSSGLGEGSAWSDGQYDASLKSSYGWSVGQSAYQQRHAAFSGTD